MDISRRTMLKSGLLAGMQGLLPLDLVQMISGLQLHNNTNPAWNGRYLVLVELFGGNDALNTLIPINDITYTDNRPTLRIASQTLLAKDIGTNQSPYKICMHPALSRSHAIFKDNKMAWVYRVGYPEQNRSHFRGIDHWETAAHNAEIFTTGVFTEPLSESATPVTTMSLG